MKISRIKAIISAFLFSAILFSVVGCAATSNTLDLMDGITPNTPDTPPPDKGEQMTDFAVRLFTYSLEDGKNTLISPLSVLSALAMTANGAKGETLSQMESVLGMETGELNEYFYSYMKSLPKDEKYKLSLANSVWFTDNESFSVDGRFLQMNANYYGAGIYRTPFDETTLRDINGWVNEKTDGMIHEILNEIPDGVVMYLVNALAFEAEWANVYDETQIRDGVFTNADGKEVTVEFMHSSDEYHYLEDEDAVGFIKYFRDGKYAFATLLPNEGVSVSDYAASLSGEHLAALLAKPVTIPVISSIPKFETEYDVEMSAVLKSMGMPNAFDSAAADFTGLGISADGNIYINRVLHKTFITVGAQGAKAGAATVVEMIPESSSPEFVESKTVTLDRPFIYMLIDCESNFPFFIGSLSEMK